MRGAPANRRGSPEAIAKRRAARAFNDMLGAGGATRDGRTEARRRRLLEELERGKARGSGKALKPLDTLLRVHELLELGEPLANLRKVCRPPRPAPPDPAIGEVLRRLHAAYAFRPETYRFVGIADEMLVACGVVPEPEARSRAARRG